MINKYNYSPGPSYVKENVRLARAYEVTNSDIDIDFVKYYKDTCDLFNKIIDSDNETYIISGEAILGLEAACATLTEDGDRVLVLDNGLYGNGFKDFVSIYGGQPVLFTQDYHNEISSEALEEYLKEDSNFKYATLVHCDTPTGMINDIHKLCPILKKYGILTVVDSVSGMVGERVSVKESKIDILLGGSQKAISAQPGITIVSVSEDAKKSFKNRKTLVRSFYANLRIWENYLEEQYFPYTLPASDIVSFRVALENIVEEGIENVLKRHEKIANAVRKSIKDFGLELFSENDNSNTVTAIKMPEKIKATDISDYILKKHNVLIATSLAEYKDSILRIGHMGENARIEKTLYILNLLEEAFNSFGFKSKKSLTESFIENIY
ncbi:pyridoxal-phosphate-dependent aminotransferase family protein [Peptostreptococcus canis]|uniref:Alanine--glyoxylate aminotransferase family protein n=1 Tax=Peptostreptococcus canis TaxID=1159213 RepID=A0ABR6TJH0_9FIRM|nr:alanine--glyoxylate aminotransferase family protein [Peptostreptococcus canis]MBC2575378.1 alanine--glyoxylate aminotransferase family protein [Peptostreptococcus canis]MBP1997439.1 aspartate aminotransferase-like enzyme [Peptostreptococcus canis]